MSLAVVANRPRDAIRRMIAPRTISRRAASKPRDAIRTRIAQPAAARKSKADKVIKKADRTSKPDNKVVLSTPRGSR